MAAEEVYAPVRLGEDPPVTRDERISEGVDLVFHAVIRLSQALQTSGMKLPKRLADKDAWIIQAGVALSKIDYMPLVDVVKWGLLQTAREDAQEGGK